MTPEEYRDARDTLIVAESRLGKLLKAKADKPAVQRAAEAVQRARSALELLLKNATPNERRAVTVDLTKDGSSSEWGVIDG